MILLVAHLCGRQCRVLAFASLMGFIAIVSGSRNYYFDNPSEILSSRLRHKTPSSGNRGFFDSRSRISGGTSDLFWLEKQLRVTQHEALFLLTNYKLHSLMRADRFGADVNAATTNDNANNKQRNNAAKPIRSSVDVIVQAEFKRRRSSSDSSSPLSPSSSSNGDAGIKRIEIKLTPDHAIAAWFDVRQQLTTCATSPLRQANVVPIEFVAALRMNGAPHFRRFYPNDSYMMQESAVNMFVYQRLASRENLKVWYAHNSNTSSYSTDYNNDSSNEYSYSIKSSRRATAADDVKLESRLKRLFRHMHDALQQLLDANMLYTDFRPENVQVNLNNDKGSAYLTNMAATVTIHNGSAFNLCVTSSRFFPPVRSSSGNGGIGRSNRNSASETDTLSRELVAEYLATEGVKAADRLLSWTFCMTLFDLVCDYGNKQASFQDRTIFAKWGGDRRNVPLHSYFECSRASRSARKLLGSCLLKNSNDPRLLSFRQIRDSEWLQS